MNIMITSGKEIYYGSIQTRVVNDRAICEHAARDWNDVLHGVPASILWDTILRDYMHSIHWKLLMFIAYICSLGNNNHSLFPFIVIYISSPSFLNQQHHLIDGAGDEAGHVPITAEGHGEGAGEGGRGLHSGERDLADVVFALEPEYALALRRNKK